MNRVIDRGKLVRYLHSVRTTVIVIVVVVEEVVVVVGAFVLYEFVVAGFTQPTFLAVEFLVTIRRLRVMNV